MASINTGRVLLGGLLAGVIVNVGEYVCNEVLFGDRIRAAMAEHGMTMPTGGAVIAIWLVWGLLLGLTAVWVYAAIRPRFGAGPKTAAIAGLTVWVPGSLLASLGMWNIGFAPRDVAAGVALWGLVEYVVATIAGAWLYKET